MNIISRIRLLLAVRVVHGAYAGGPPPNGAPPMSWYWATIDRAHDGRYYEFASTVVRGRVFPHARARLRCYGLAATCCLAARGWSRA